MVKENLRIAQTRQKSYADHRRRDLEFVVGDYVYLKVSPIRGLRRFKVKGKLAPRLSGVHGVFHVSQLKKCLRVPKEQLQIDDLNILEAAERLTRNRVIKMCKVKWSHYSAEVATWEREDDLRTDYPELFASQS
ncbi:hypothetical protein U9M48_039361 [Paspalum notatum var. saurae]|uniref:Chromo domain-containing protein n=1 Tax=Paspalum notatum var. saurae TaxID=547442 RepID=A0AAQ3UJH0_PASNO